MKRPTLYVDNQEQMQLVIELVKRAKGYGFLYGITFGFFLGAMFVMFIR